MSHAQYLHEIKSTRNTALTTMVMYFVLAVLFVLSVAIPNAFKNIMSGILIVCVIVSTLSTSFRNIRHKYFLFLAASSVISIVFGIYGLVKGAPEEAFSQLLIVYILFPLLWGLFFCTIVRYYSINTIVSWLVWGILACAISVVFYFWSYETFGRDSVRFLSMNANVDVNNSDGYVAASMHVYGSMIFITGALFSSPTVIKNKIVRTASIFLAIAIAFTSGRSALILSMPIGILVFGVNAIIDRRGRISIHAPFRLLLFALLGFIAISSVVGVFSYFFRFDLMLGVTQLVQKLSSGGGDVRHIEAISLWDGAVQSNGLGVGYGIPASFLASTQYVWRYELVWMATIYRFGLFGAAVYAAPFLLTIWVGGRRLMAGHLSTHERFLFGGFLAAFLASNTNPYIEGIVFQWMYVLPVVYFLSDRKSLGSMSRSRSKGQMFGKGRNWPNSLGSTSARA